MFLAAKRDFEARGLRALFSWTTLICLMSTLSKEETRRITFDIYLTTTKQLVKRNTSYLVGTVISPNLSYLLAVRLAASTAIPLNTHKVKRKKKTLQIKPSTMQHNFVKT